KGSVISLEDDLGLPGEPSIPYFELAYGVAFRLHFGFMYSVREGDERQDGNTRFNGHIIGVAGDTLEGRSELLTADFMLGSTIYRKGAVRVELLTGGKFIHLENRITTDNPTANPKSSTDVVDVPALYIGFGGHVLLSQTLTFYARYLYTQFAWEVFDVEKFFYIDLTLGFTYLLWPGVGLSVDYRLIRLEITEDNSGHESDYDLYGNGVGITLLLTF
ncbi:MAG: hypothetical protein O7H41_20990, partial [Planctomycetota bacterium]|nr:hypothetical protein [Planctomycetota bacterium]